jgi:extracellular factor (EF) 3-hydroxypalmitic acid methyl ester biosynthesis protein
MSSPASMILAKVPVTNRRETQLLTQFDDLFQDFIVKGGPLPPEYVVLNRAIRHLADAIRAGAVGRGDVLAYVQDATQRYLPGTMQAEALERKYGYSGDFEIIDHIYTRRICPDPKLRLWDLYFHAQAAPVAVRNRKAYFQQLMGDHLARSGGALDLLNVACGPCRDLREFFLDQPDASVSVDCVDMDARAIEYGSRLCAPWLERISFHHRNILKHVPTRAYDLVWSAGLFDYLSDRLFVHLLSALLRVVKPGGEVVIGNFSDFNPSRDFMEIFGHWNLRHRSQQTLRALAVQAGATAEQVQIYWEPEGVNYFLHIRR